MSLNKHDPSAYIKSLKEKKKEIDKISPTFCAAKWLQSTILLYSGESHACHHPPRHKITLEDIKNNPKGIHNTAHIMKAREDMLNGIQTPECAYCWNIENLKEEHISDRIYKSSFSWSFPHIKDLAASGRGPDTNPTYMEVAFESTCNLKCLYCSPESSTTWEKEIKEHGPIKQTDFNLHDLNYLKKVKKLPIPADEYNPYIEAFWKWWPELYPNLHTFRITGGEPLLSKHTWKILDYIKNNPTKNQNLTLAINTNLSVQDNKIEQLIRYIKEISPNVLNFDIYTSIESSGKHAEYTRNGLIYEKFLKNIENILENTNNKTRIHLMTTINLTSAPTFLNFLKYLKSMREKYYSELHAFRVRTHISFLLWPKTLQLSLLSKEDKEKYANEWLDYIHKNKLITKEEDHENFMNRVFYNEEVDQVERLTDYMLNTTIKDKKIFDDMRLYIKQCDERRKTNFIETFPELKYLMKEDYYG